MLCLCLIYGYGVPLTAPLLHPWIYDGFCVAVILLIVHRQPNKF